MQRNAADTEQVDRMIASLVKQSEEYIMKVDSEWRNVAENDLSVRDLVALRRLNSLSNSQLFSLIDAASFYLGIVAGHLDAIREFVDEGYSGLNNNDRVRIFGGVLKPVPPNRAERPVLGLEDHLMDRVNAVNSMANELRARLYSR